MSRTSQTIEFEGYFAEGVLGIFKIIRGVADLLDLAAVLSENWVREMAKRTLALEAHHTTHIEGTRLTWEQAVQS